MYVEIPAGVTSVDALIVAGGGGGAFSGGGAGGLIDTTRSGSPYLVGDADDSGSVELRVLVGAGGNPGRVSSFASGDYGSRGGESFLERETDGGVVKATAVGGGGGVSRNYSNDGGGYISGVGGGSGSGAVVWTTQGKAVADQPGGSDTDAGSLGNAGGDAQIGNTCSSAQGDITAVAGGGGGAGTAGKKGWKPDCDFGSVSGEGGAGLSSSITGVDTTLAAGGELSGGSVFYAGGGAGGRQNDSKTEPNVDGGIGGGGDTTYLGSHVASRDTNTGGGGGGVVLAPDEVETDVSTSSQTGSAGDSGIVVIRYSLPSVAIDQSDSDVAFGETLGLSATLGPGGGSVEWSSDDAACTFDNTSSSTPTLTPAFNAGQSCDVTVSQTGGSQGDSQDTITVSVVKANQASLTVTNSGDIGFEGSVELAVTGGSGDGLVSWSESCTNFVISGTTLSTTAAVNTTCTVTAEKASSTNYNSATATKDFTVGKASPVFDSYDPVSAQVGSADVTLDDPTVQVNGSAFTAGSIGWTSADDTVADVTGSTLSFESVGETTLTATFTPTDSSSYETVTLAVTVTVTAVPPAPRGGNDDDEATPVPTAGPTVGPAVPGRPGVPGGVPGRPGGNPGGVVSPGVTPGGGTPPPPPGGTSGNPIPPERPGATIGGQPVPTTTTASPGGRGVSVSAGGVDVGVDVPDGGDGAGGVIDRGGIPEPVVTPGQGKTVSGAGAAPGSVVDVWLPGRGGNAPTNIAQIPVGADGTFSADVDVFAGSGEPLPIGRNVVQIVTTNAEGEDIVVDMPFTITQGEPTPEVLRATNETPNAPVVGVVATNRGEPEQVTIDSEPTQGSIRVTADAWDFTISVDTATSSVQGSDTTTTIAATNTTEVTVSGSGFMADTRVDVWAFSTPTLLASATVTTEGTATVTVELDPTVLTGEHTLQLQAVGDDGYVRTANLPVTLTDTPPTTTNTANSLLWWTVGLIALIILAAVVTTLVIRSRQS
ncbi:glycine-rich domain-containing protein [Pontimonas salivibrio]